MTLPNLSDQEALNGAMLTLAAFWALCSAGALINNARAGARVAASLWAMSLTGSCMVVVYLLRSLL